MREYVASLPFTLEFQDVEHELGALFEQYGPPGGAALLGLVDGTAVGCAGVRALEPPEVAELKRMYVKPAARGIGLGRALTRASLEAARRLGYRRIRLDTVEEMREAGELYRSEGFVEIPAYRHNPLPTARYFEADLTAQVPAAPRTTRGGRGAGAKARAEAG